MDITREQVQKILDNAPQGSDKKQILDGLVQRGFNIEGIDMGKVRASMQVKQEISNTQGNQFDEAQKPTSFLGKARNLATSLIGGGKLAEGAGMAIASKSVQPQLEQASQALSDTELALVKRINEKKRNGEDVSRLENALTQLKGSQIALSDTQQDFTDALPTNKEVIGSSVRLAGTLAGGAIARGFAPATKTTGLGAGIAQGAKVGALTGATEGAIQGAGIGLEQNQSAGGVVSSALGGATLGGVTGGVLGGVLGGVTGKLKASQELKTFKQNLLETNPDSRVAKYTLDGQGKITNDPIAKEVIKQGVDEGTVATIKGSSQADKSKMLKALDIAEKAQTDKKFSATNRPSDVIGDSVLERFNIVKSANKQAGQQLDSVAKNLSGQKTNPIPAVQSFVSDLEDIGVTFKNGQPVFAGSNIEGIKPAETLIKKVITRMNQVSDDAYEIHKLKKFLDEQVSYGKTAEGLTGKTEGILKGLRANLDSILDNSFPEYNQVNSQFSSTKTALDNFLSSAGSKFDVNAPGAEKQIGTLARRVLSNAQSRVQVTNALNDLQTVAEQFGGKFDDDIITQIVFVDELERLFGTSASTSLAGEVSKGVQKATGIVGKMKSAEGIFDLALQAGAEGIEKARGINKEGLVSSLREILK